MATMENRWGFVEGRKIREEATTVVQISVGDVDQCGGLGEMLGFWSSFFSRSALAF